MKKIIRTMKFKILLILFVLLTISVYSKDKSDEDIFIKGFDTILKYDYNENFEKSEDKRSLAKSFVTNGSVYQQQNNYADAILEFQEALLLDSTASICYAIAKSYEALGFSVSAIRFCQTSIRLDPFFTPSYELLYRIFNNFGLTDNAFLVSKQLLKIDSSTSNKFRYVYDAIDLETNNAQVLLEKMIDDSSNIDAMWLLASLYDKIEKNDEKVILLTKITELEPYNYDALSELIDYYTQKNELKRIFPLLDRADKTMDNDKINILYSNVGRGIIRYEAGVKDTLFLKDFLKRFDDRFYFDSYSQVIAGNLASYIGDTINTLKYLNRAFFLSQDDILPYQIAVLSYSNLKLYDSLVNVINQANEKFPENTEFFQLATNTLYSDELYDQAIIYCTKLYELDSTNIYYMFTLADLYQMKENFEESDKFYEKALELDPMNVLISNNYAYSLSTRNLNLPKALKLSQYAIEVEPENAAYLDTYGWIQYQIGNYDEALQYVLKSVELDTTSSLVLEHLGDIYIKLKKNDFALDAYKKSLNLDDQAESVLSKIKELEK